MSEIEKIDIKENKIYDLDPSILDILLFDRTSNRNIIWATENYLDYGLSYKFHSEIMPYSITGTKGNIIRPRVKKSKEEQNCRVKDKAEVFTPSWICNMQNNLVDESWFGYKNVFNKAINNDWVVNNKKIVFPKDKNWKDYISSLRLEISCGEAPYLVSRYDTVNGDILSIEKRIGIIDRKFRILNENIDDDNLWFDYCIEIFKSCYGYEWQGDNLLLARENLLYTFIDYYYLKYHITPSIEQQKCIADIISWNIWQMDGIKFVIPDSCNNEKITCVQMTIFGEEERHIEECYGCKKNNYKRHNGKYCKIMNWKTNRTKLFYKLMERGNNNE